MKDFGIVIRHINGKRCLFGRIRRSDTGNIYVIWEMSQSCQRKNNKPKWNPHASYHASGQLHSKSYNRIGIKKQRQSPTPAFTGSEPIEATNADRGLNPVLPIDIGGFDDYFEIDVTAIASLPNAVITVDIVAPGAVPIRLTGLDTVVTEKVFKDTIPWIVVSLVDPPS